MQTLETEFTYDGFDFKQIAREGDVVLFEKYKPGHARAHYELIIVQLHEAATRFGKEYPDRELMPPTTAWGKAGWSHADLESGTTAFKKLVSFRKKHRHGHWRVSPDSTSSSEATQIAKISSEAPRDTLCKK